MKEDINNDLSDIKHWLHIFFNKRYWFLASVVIALVIAAVYIAVTIPMYTRHMSVLVKESDKGNTASPMAGAEAFSDMGLFKSKTDIKNEVHIIKSPILMESVVSRLQLNRNYSQLYNGVRMVDMYNTSPIEVKVDSILSDRLLKFVVSVEDNNVDISYLEYNNIEYSGKWSGDIDKPIELPCGAVVVSPTMTYQNMEPGQTIYYSQMPASAAAKLLLVNFRASLSKDDASIIEMSVLDAEPRRAEDILSMLVTIYNENWIKDKNQITISTSQFINDRLNVIEQELGNVDDNISEYKSSNLIPDIAAVSGIYLSQASLNDEKQVLLDNQLAMAKYVKEFLFNSESKDQLLPVNTGIDNVNIENLIVSYNADLLQRNNLLANSSNKNPLVADLNQRLSSVRKVIATSIDDYISTLGIQVDKARSQGRSTNLKIATSPGQAKYLLSVERQQKVKEQLYLFLLQKREENELSQTFTAYNTKVVNPPAGEINATSPRKSRVLLVALFIGVLIPGLLIFIKESLDTTIKGRSDLDSLTVPLLGEIPQVFSSKGMFGRNKIEMPDNGLVVNEQDRDFVNEAFRILRTNIDFVKGDTSGGYVMMNTSFNVGSGKSFVVQNLGMSFAIKGNKTILVDLDLRKGVLSKLVNSPTTGVSNYLASKSSDIDSFIVKGEIHPCMDVLPIGVIPPNPSELLLTPRFAEMITYLRAKYDYILLDCPPVELVSDPQIIEKQVDQLLFVVRVGLLERHLLPALDSMYKEHKFKSMALILNGSQANSRYGYGYGNGYGYGYGYGEGKS